MGLVKRRGNGTFACAGGMTRDIPVLMFSAMRDVLKNPAEPLSGKVTRSDEQAALSRLEAKIPAAEQRLRDNNVQFTAGQ
ncbi:MAG TPA: hypothetical protein VLL74_03300 [Methanoregula sp.]|nr:hypothetical protein [Methanoregula sp.]